MKKPIWLLKLIEFVSPGRRIKIIEGDTPPARLPLRNIVLAREDGENWAVGFRCPCGCGKKLELLLIKEASPNWKLSVDEGGKPTLYPSVWLKTGCKSHFWVRSGKVVWC
ncbi:DUF6527 family protein [Pontibacter sp. JAM-7]|uniref:DUF6527 family protein n=1 Tax=Pontibacter sp. JAM-7 TaxID=3366581 RepID=UPI003AF9AA5F